MNFCKTSRLLLSVVLVILSGCGGLREYVANGYNIDKDYSIFSRFSGSYCTLRSPDARLEYQINCENLQDMTAVGGDFCRKHVGESWSAFFPDESSPMTLCQNKSFPERPAQAGMRIIVFGDSGAGDDATKGTRQTLVAEAMAKVCPYRGDLGTDASANGKQRACDFAVVVGDVVYPNGVSNVFDSQFETRFEAPYSQLGGLPFYIAPGNHDYHGNVTAMVEYDMFSKRWHMPGRYYPLPDLPAWLNIFGIDSVAMTADDGVKSNFNEQMAALSGDFCGRDGWKIILGHYPPQSNGGHGRHKEQALALNEIAKTCPFHLYLAGHDHHLEYLTTDRYNILISGGGGAVRKNVNILPEGTLTQAPEFGLRDIAQKYAKSAHGFSVLEIKAGTLDIYYFDIDRWNPVRGIFNQIPSFEDFDFHCQSTIDNPLSCI